MATDIGAPGVVVAVAAVVAVGAEVDPAVAVAVAVGGLLLAYDGDESEE